MGIIEKHFTAPLQYDGFNIYNTLVYTLILVLGLYGTIRLFKFLDIQIDRRFYSFLAPLIFLGTSLNVLKILGELTSPWFSSVGVYGIIYFLLIGTIFFGKLVEKISVPYFYFPMLISVFFSILTFAKLLKFEWNFMPAAGILATSGVLVLCICLSLNHVGFYFVKDKINASIIFSHMLDASATFIGIAIFGFTEQVLLTKALISDYPVLIFPLKLGILLPVLYFVDKIEDRTGKDVIKAVLLTLGLAPGLRNAFLISLYWR